MAKLVETQAKVAEVFKRIDAHSHGVQRSTYILRGPVDDAMLAKQIVELAIGEPVPWPAEDIQDDANIDELIEKIMDDDGAAEQSADGDAEQQIEDDADMPWFPHAEFFGIPDPLAAITDCGENAQPLLDEHAPSSDANNVQSQQLVAKRHALASRPAVAPDESGSGIPSSSRVEERHHKNSTAARTASFSHGEQTKQKQAMEYERCA